MIQPKLLESLDFKFVPARRFSRSFSPYLCVVLHGRGDDLRSFTEIDEELRIPGMNYLLVNAPRKYDTGYTWYGFPPRQKLGVLHSRAKLIQLLDELEGWGWFKENVFLLGHSQGSLMVNDMGMSYPEKLAGLVGVSGYIYFHDNWRDNLPQSAFQQSWLVTHGIFDEDLPIEPSRGQVRLMQREGLPVQWEEFQKEHHMDSEEEMKFIANWMKERMDANLTLRGREALQFVTA